MQGRKFFQQTNKNTTKKQAKTIRIPKPGNLIFGLMKKCQQMQRDLFKLENIVLSKTR